MGTPPLSLKTRQRVPNITVAYLPTHPLTHPLTHSKQWLTCRLPCCLWLLPLQLPAQSWPNQPLSHWQKPLLQRPCPLQLLAQNCSMTSSHQPPARPSTTQPQLQGEHTQEPRLQHQQHSLPRCLFMMHSCGVCCCLAMATDQQASTLHTERSIKT